MMAWVLLAIAIASEVVGTTALKASEGFSKPLPTAIVVVGYVVAFTCLGLAVRTMSVSVAYAVWAGLGTAAIAVIGLLVFRESMGMAQMAGLILIITGVVLLNATGGSHA